MTFSEKFCAKHNGRPEDFEATVLRMSLKPSARLFQPILNLNPHYFAADREFVRGVGRISRIEDFGSEAHDFTEHPDGSGFFHRSLGLRISRRRLLKLVRDVLVE
jgi:hypothetical protein